VIRGLIDLSEVETISQGLSSYLNNSQFPQYATTKKALNNMMTGNAGSSIADSKCYFEVKTSKRVYYFCAKTQVDSSKWVKQLQLCCQDS